MRVCSVPQASVLSPRLFVLHIADLMRDTSAS